jgi:tripartite-type tricarboxylate transporter receptor subunit TctC
LLVRCRRFSFEVCARATTYPAKPIRLIVPFPPGGGTDILSRLVANKLTEVSKWTVVPDNRGGAGGTIGIAEAVRAAPTGYDMVMGQKDNLVVAPWLYKNLSYDPTKDLVAVAHVAYTPVVIVTGRAVALQDAGRRGGRRQGRARQPSPTARPATAPPSTWPARSSTAPPTSSCATCLTRAPTRP